MKHRFRHPLYLLKTYGELNHSLNGKTSRCREPFYDVTLDRVFDLQMETLKENIREHLK